MLVGQLLSRGEVDARDLEQRDVVGAGVDTRARGFDETRHDGGPEDGLLRGHGTREPDCLGARIGRDEAPRVCLGEAGPDERVLDDTAQTLLLREAATDVAPQRHRERDAVEKRPRDLLDDVDLACDVARAPGRHGHVPCVGDVEAEPEQRRALLLGRDVEADHPRRALRTQTNDRALRQPVVHIGVTRHSRSGEVDEHPAGEDRGRLCEMRIDALLPPVRSRGAEREPLR